MRTPPHARITEATSRPWGPPVAELMGHPDAARTAAVQAYFKWQVKMLIVHHRTGHRRSDRCLRKTLPRKTALSSSARGLTFH
ncbi:hypothetical protein J1605_004584 [Eschrichtius robustus]|uniref:Uncharacterized protein n=1 Tax=Eschrichtius robustus TaxID=9764 RepID=A0AB34HHZ0_ESCRO|nr:hypothetical protein J1605_004584 [Eschrichtius robustus]